MSNKIEEGNEPYIIYPWTMSSQGSRNLGFELKQLKDDTPQELANYFCGRTIEIQQNAFIELLTHGNPRKAAQVARALVVKDPSIGKLIRERFGGYEVKLLLEIPLELLASCPSEFPKHIHIKYIQ